MDVQLVNSLAAVAMHPATRSVLARATMDLDMAGRRLTAKADAIEIDNLDAWLCLVEQRLQRVREAIDARGSLAVPEG